MAAPTQEYPPWLSVSSSVLTDAAGEPTATLTTVLNLPLTYYGPSIPLGTDGAWVYGGLTSPAPQTSTPTASSPQSTTSAIPSLSSPVVSTASSSASTLTPSSPSTSSAPASSTSALPASASSSSGRIPASVIAVVAVVAAIVLFVVLAFLIWLRRQVLRRRADSRLPRQISPFPNDPAYAYDSLLSRNQPVESRRAPGEGSPRGSGEEHDPFLRPSVSPANGFGTRLVHYGPTDPTPASAGYAAPFSRYHDGVQAKEFGISTFAAIKRSLKGKATAPPPDRFTPAPVPRPRSPRSQVSKNIESPSVLSQKLDVALQSPSSPPGGDDDASKPLLGGAITRNTERSRRSRHGSDRSRRSGHASLGDDDVEFGEAHTANRAEYHAVEDQHLSPTQRWAQAVNLPSFTELGRNSWVKRILQGSTTPTRSESHMQSHSRPDSYGDRTTSRVFPADLDLGAEGLHEPLQPPPPAREMGMLDTRPISTGSGKSAGTGGTVFYDARSRPGSVNYSTASTDRWKSHPSPLRSDVPPPAYETTLPLQPPPAARSPTQDVLDMPVPRAISPFATASNATSRSSPPPGLNMPNVWRQSAGTSGNRTSGSGEIRIDVLEDPPPAPPPVWTSLRDAGPEGDRRMTFGGPATAQVTTSNENLYSSSHYPSVHSSPHLHPRDNSSVSGSNSSRQHSQEQSGSSGRAPSTSSHGQRLRSTAVSPPLSAVGDRRAARVSDISTSENAPAPVLNSTIGSAGTSASVTTHGSVYDSRTGEVMRFPIVPHTMGLETHAEDRDKESDGFDSWTGPDHYMALRAPSVSESGYAE